MALIRYSYIDFSNADIPFTNVYVINGVGYLISINKTNILDSYTTATSDSYRVLYTIKIDDTDDNNLLTTSIVMGENLTKFSSIPFKLVATPLENINIELTARNLGEAIKLVYDVQRV